METAEVSVRLTGSPEAKDGTGKYGHGWHHHGRRHCHGHGHLTSGHGFHHDQQRRRGHGHHRAHPSEGEVLLGPWMRSGRGRSHGHGHGKHPEKVLWKSRPKADVFATSEAYTLTMELPGFQDGDAAVAFRTEEKTLLPVVVVEGERKASSIDEDAKMLLQERQVGPFRRRFVFPADAAHVAAAISQTQGLLTVTIPRRPVDTPSAPALPMDGDTFVDAPRSPMIL